MLKVGDKVTFDDGKFVGYIVKIEIDPLEEDDVKSEWVFYTIRVFSKIYIDGYTDFVRGENDLVLYSELAQLSMFDMLE